MHITGIVSLYLKRKQKKWEKERITGKNIYFVWDEFFAQFFVALYTGQFPWNIADNCSIINVMITTPINYLMNKFWTFAEKG